MRHKGTLVAAALAGLFAAGCNKTDNAAPKAQAAKVKCQGANACAGKGGCKGADNECAGKNGCKGKGWVETASADECTSNGGKVL